MSEVSRKDPPAGKGKPKGRRPRRGETSTSKASEVGKALRSVYDSTLREEVPGDFLDLLGKLN